MDDLKACRDYQLFVLGLGGSFSTALFTAIQHADHVNLERLRLAFPAEVAVCRGASSAPALVGSRKGLR